jgi:hypothetical protein
MLALSVRTFRIGASSLSNLRRGFLPASVEQVSTDLQALVLLNSGGLLHNRLGYRTFHKSGIRMVEGPGVHRVAIAHKKALLGKVRPQRCTFHREQDCCLMTTALARKMHGVIQWQEVCQVQGSVSLLLDPRS